MRRKLVITRAVLELAEAFAQGAGEDGMVDIEPLTIAQVDSAVVAEHVRLCAEEELIANETLMVNDRGCFWAPRGLTTRGHALMDAMRMKRVSELLEEHVRLNGGTVSTLSIEFMAARVLDERPDGADNAITPRADPALWRNDGTRRNRLRSLAEHLQTMRPETYIASHWALNGVGELESAGEATCEGGGCAIGWGAAELHREEARVAWSWEGFAQAAYGMVPGTLSWMYCFATGWAVVNPTPQAAARRIEWILDGRSLEGFEQGLGAMAKTCGE